MFLLAVSMTGCVLDSPPPQGTPCGDEQHPLAYVDYTNGICYSENCTSENSCCHIADSVLRSTIYNAFRYGRCPSNTVISECAADGEVYKCYPGCGYGFTYCEGNCLPPNAYENSYCDPETEKLACRPNFDNCNNIISDGCEASLLNDDDHCGQCGTKCKAGEVCNDGTCKLNECSERDPDRPKQCSVDGHPKCVDTSSDRDHCGNCNHRCEDVSPVYAISQGCKSGICQYVCERNYVQISENSDEGILCVDPGSNEYCGATSSENKGVNCNDNNLHCFDGQCIENSCTDNKLACNIGGITECIHVKSDNAAHCGACNYRCSDHVPNHAVSDGCSAGICLYTCESGYVNVGGGNTEFTIKCIDPMTDNTYCGATGPSSTGTPCTGMVCVAGQCMVNSCANGELQCGENDCRISDMDNCGACNYKCADHVPLNAESVTCSENRCQYRCQKDYVNIGLDDTTRIWCVDPTSKEYCGAQSAADPGKACNYDQKCERNECIAVCSGQTFCSKTDGTYLCADTQSNRDNCGQCFHACNTGEYCLDGECAKEWTCDQTTCELPGGSKACVDIHADLTHCGECNHPCQPASNAAEMDCRAGTCVIKSCQKGYKLDGSQCIKETCDNSDYALIEKAYRFDGTTINVRAYCIRSEADLISLGKAVSNGQTYPAENTDNAYILANDITIKSSPWTPVGTDQSKPFQGIFYGQKKAIKSDSEQEIQLDNNNSGVFGYIQKGAVYDLSLELNLNANKYSNVGSLAGTVNNSYIAGIIVKGTKVIKGKTSIGGLIGQAQNHSIIQNIQMSNMTISSTGDYCGGVVGNSDNSHFTKIAIDKSSIMGTNYMGGIAGISKASTIEECHSQNNTFGGSSSAAYAGGIVGTSTGSTYNNSYSLNSVSIYSTTGGFVAQSGANDKYTECYASGTFGSSDITGGFVGDAKGGSFTRCASYGAGSSGKYSGGFVGIVTSSSHFEQCYSTATITGGGSRGGFVGDINAKADFIQSYALGTVTSGNTNACGAFAGTASTTEQVKLSKFFFNKDAAVSSLAPDGIDKNDKGKLSELPLGFNIVNNKAVYNSSSLSDALGSPFEDTKCIIEGTSYTTLPMIPAVLPETLDCK